MNEVQRHREITAWVNADGFINVSDIIERFQVSPATARRDITKLSDQGKLNKVRNGAERLETPKGVWEPLAVSDTQSYWAPIGAGDIDNYQEKVQMAAKVSALCKDGESILLNCGSTAFLLGKQLCGRNLQIVTNYFPLAQYLIENDHDRVIIVGGQYYKKQKVMLNPTPDSASAYAADWMFTSGKGLTEAGLYKTDMLTAVSEQQMLNSVGKLVVVVDSAKVGKCSGMLFCPATNIDILITGKNADKTVISSLVKQGVKVILV